MKANEGTNIESNLRWVMGIQDLAKLRDNLRKQQQTTQVAIKDLCIRSFDKQLWKILGMEATSKPIGMTQETRLEGTKSNT